MPVIHVDTEQAALIKAALTMFEAALTARVERVDPEQVISKALNLQSLKLATVRQLLDLPEPPAYSELSPTMRKLTDDLVTALAAERSDPAADRLFERLRGVLVAPAFPAPAEAGQLRVSPVQGRRKVRKAGLRALQPEAEPDHRA